MHIREGGIKGAMLNSSFRRLTLLSAIAAYLLVVLGGAGRAFWGFSSGGDRLLDIGYRMAALAVFLPALAGAYAGGRQLLAARPALTVGVGTLAALALPAIAGGPHMFGLPAPHLGLASAFIATWLVGAVFGGGDSPYPSRLSMFRSQWQVPLYAALAAYVVVVLGSYLTALGDYAACTGWPLCDGLSVANLSGVLLAHLAHRTAAALSGVLLIYTVAFVWRRHQHRPVLLALTGTAVVFYTSVVMLGAQAARSGLTPLEAVGHNVIAAALIGTLVAVAAVGYYAPSLPAVAGASLAVPLGVSRPLREVAQDYLETTKPRILVLLLITGYAAMWVGARGVPNIGLTLVTMLGLAMSCGAANAINMWWDQDIDQIMARTRKRPIPSGRLTPDQVLSFGVLTGALSFVLLAAAVNLLTAALSLAGLLFYVCIYTMWLKRSTDQNIVIGGAAGAIPPLVGWAAVTGEMSWAGWIMFLIIFVWTPPHFWALALYRNDDYRAANVPMLPVVRGEMNTKWQILLYSLALFPTVMALYWTGVAGPIYLWVSMAATAVYLAANIALFRERLPVYKWARKSFFWSILWLGFIFLFMMLDVRA